MLCEGLSLLMDIRNQFDSQLVTEIKNSFVVSGDIGHREELN